MTQKPKQPASPVSQPVANTETPDIDFHGAAIVGDDGQEVPITEEMVKSACDQLKPDSHSTSE